MDRGAGRGGGVGRDLRQLAAQRMREGDVRHQATSEERADAAFRAIEELIGDEDVERFVFFLQAADLARREDALDAQHLEAVDVGAEIQLQGQNPVTDTVAREKRHALSSKRAENVRTGGISEGG